MDKRYDSLCLIMGYAANPECEYDRIIAQNKKYIPLLSTEQLCTIYWHRMSAVRLCRLIPYSREDVRSLVENEEVDPLNRVAELDYAFTVLEYIFSKVNGEEF
ncbi:MAG: hypothetical protein IK955_09315 [Clostridia bacterium]|nr:hypothetical protein [Clostridia bacterium]